MQSELLTRGERIFKALSGATLVVVLTLLYLPVLLMAVLSFQGEARTRFPPSQFTLASYGKLFHPSNFALYTIPGEPIINYFPPLRLSLILALTTAVLGTALALAAAIGFRHRFAGRRIAFYLICLGMVIPGIVLGLGLRLFTDTANIPAQWYTTGILVHVAWTLPFGFLVFLIFLNRFDRTIETAAAVLGASPFHVFRTITLPLLRPALLGSLLFGFTLSFDEVQRSTLVLGPDENLPHALVAASTIRITPVIYAIGTLIATVSLILVTIYLVVFERERERLIPQPEPNTVEA